MKRFIAAAIAAIAVAVIGGPALAQYAADTDHHDWSHHDWDHGDQPDAWDLDRRIDWMQDRIDKGRADRSLSRHEAWRAQDELNDIRHEEERLQYQHRGLYDSDRQQLQQRLDELGQRIRWQRHSGDIPPPWMNH